MSDELVKGIIIGLVLGFGFGFGLGFGVNVRLTIKTETNNIHQLDRNWADRQEELNLR